MSDHFGFFTGGQGDSNHDGKVSFTEYDNHMDDFNRIYRKNGTPTSSGKYKPDNTSNSNTNITVDMPKWLWVVMFICCFTPIFSSITNCNGEYMGECVVLTIIFLISWIFAFANRAK